jgi:L-ascorbate metabolism protein UlaG (beta-lactamase superfamily)
MKKAMVILLYLTLSLFLIAVLILQHPIFGKNPSGERLKRIQNSKYFDGKEFKNLSNTPQLTNGATYYSLVYEMLLGNKPLHLAPEDSIPSVKTDLKNLPDYTLVWFGHSSYFFKAEGKTFLIDPVLSGSASPLSSSVKSFKGADIYTTDDFPTVDYLIISHDHYDHLDYKTIKKLVGKVQHVVCGLGVGEHLEHWGFSPKIITELEWHESTSLENKITITSTPARHFSGRALKRNNTLWSSYVLKTHDFKLFIGGDSGFDTHFKSIGETYGPFDVAILENGQYNKSWQNIHTLPDELMSVKHDLKAKAIFPVHSSKFTLARHAWNEPLELASLHAEKSNDRILTPKIGEPLRLKDSTQFFEKWWRGIK